MAKTPPRSGPRKAPPAAALAQPDSSPAAGSQLKRVSLLLREDQHQALLQKSENYSATIRELIDAYLNQRTLMLPLSANTAQLIERIKVLTILTPVELERALERGLKSVLQEAIEKLKRLEKEL